MLDPVANHLWLVVLSPGCDNVASCTFASSSNFTLMVVVLNTSRLIICETFISRILSLTLGWLRGTANANFTQRCEQ